MKKTAIILMIMINLCEGQSYSEVMYISKKHKDTTVILVNKSIKQEVLDFFNEAQKRGINTDIFRGLNCIVFSKDLDKPGYRSLGTTFINPEKARGSIYLNAGLRIKETIRAVLYHELWHFITQTPTHTDSKKRTMLNWNGEKVKWGKLLGKWKKQKRKYFRQLKQHQKLK